MTAKKHHRNTAETVSINADELGRLEKLSSLGMLAAGAAHEINNPVSYVHSNLRTLSDYVQTFKMLSMLYRRFIDAIRVNDAGEAKKIIREIQYYEKNEDLDFVLEDADRLMNESLEGASLISEVAQNLKSYAADNENKFVPTDLNECVKAAVRIAWNELKQKADVEVKCGDIPTIQCRKTQITQVILNLLINGSHAIDGNGKILVETTREENGIFVRVCDTGKGISPEHLEDVFEPFFTTRKQQGGTGLGLSVCREIVNEHKGNITLESTLGKGTCFAVYLPNNTTGESDE